MNGILIIGTQELMYEELLPNTLQLLRIYLYLYLGTQGKSGIFLQVLSMKPIVIAITQRSLKRCPAITLHGKDKSKKKKTTKSSIDGITFDPNPSSSGGEESISSRRSSSPDSDRGKKRRGGSGDRSKLETGSSKAKSAPQNIVPPQKARPKNYIPLKKSPHTDKERHIK